MRLGSLILSIALGACAVAFCYAPEADARRPPPPGYTSAEIAVTQSDGYWVWEPGQLAAINTQTNLRCPLSIGAYHIARLSNVFERQFETGSCIYANSTGRMFSILRYRPSAEGEADRCDGSLRSLDPAPAVASCFSQNGWITSVLAGTNPPLTDSERAFVGDLIEVTGNR